MDTDTNIKPDTNINAGMYQQQYETYSKQLVEVMEKSGLVTFGRGIVFIASVVFALTGYHWKNNVLFIMAAAAFLFFLLLIRYHNKIREEEQYLLNCRYVIRDYQARFNDKWKQSELNGTQYLDDTLLETRDLDIFGNQSLFQYICTASTVWGQDQLADWLCQSAKLSKASIAPAVIQNRQEAVAELAAHPDFILHFEATARSLRSSDYQKTQTAIHDFFRILNRKTTPSMLRKTAVRLFPAMTLLFFLAGFAGIHRPFTLSCFAILVCCQLMAALFGRLWNDSLLSPIYNLNKLLKPYRKLLECLEQQSFDCFYLRDLQSELFENGPASAALKELEKITEAVNIRHNLYAFLLYNSLFLYDYRCVDHYVQWQDNYRTSITKWLQVIGKIEALISLSVVCRTRKTHTMPDITSLPCLKLSAGNLKHPLLPNETAVGNDFQLKGHTCIITGSNMSGKTTFMRSIGTNLILAYAGGYCTAEKFHVSLMDLYTSIRTEDNVNEGISTFYAEILRIKNMIDAGKIPFPMIAFIDEIYKGTNAKDRIYAAKETVKNLSQPHIFTMLTTHDFELCDLETDARLDAENYYFSEYYEQNKIRFDYIIKKGRCTTTNARYLLRMAGILQNADI